MLKWIRKFLETNCDLIAIGVLGLLLLVYVCSGLHPYLERKLEESLLENRVDD